MTYTITEGLPGIVSDGQSIWTIRPSTLPLNSKPTSSVRSCRPYRR